VSPRIRRTRQAKRDLIEIATHIGNDSPRHAARFLHAARADIRKLAAMPGIGSLRELHNARLIGTRSWPISGFRNYLVFYRPLDDGIEVVRVPHGARDVDQIVSS
jgi:toxin ParE1/3/4